MLKMYSVPAQIEACYNPEDESWDLDAISSVKMETQEKAIGYVVVIKNLSGEEAAIHAEIERLKSSGDKIYPHQAESENDAR